MSLRVAQTKLQDSAKVFRARWEQACAGWEDAVRARFEEEYIDPVETTIRSGVTTMGRMLEQIAAMERDCR